MLLLLALFLAADLLIAAVFQPFIMHSGRFYCNDYELTRRDHPEETWDKVFFGNSVVISSYREDLSQSGYINLGLDYGVVEDLWDMIQKDMITIGSELVIGLNDLTLYDHFETNPTYPWHQDWYEPYIYFQRDRLRQTIEDTGKQVLGIQPQINFAGQEKARYYGTMSTQRLEEKLATSPYVNLPIEDFQDNIMCLGQITDYCKDKGIRLRCVWMPINPDIKISEESRKVYNQVKKLCEEQQVEFLDLERALNVSCFYDVGHLNYEYGAYRFMEVIEPWLIS